MYCASSPSGKRINAPAMIGIQSTEPRFGGRPQRDVSGRNGAIAPFNTQIRHENVKYKNAANSVGACPDARNALNLLIGAELQTACHSGRRAETATLLGSATVRRGGRAPAAPA